MTTAQIELVATSRGFDKAKTDMAGATKAATDLEKATGKLDSAIKSAGNTASSGGKSFASFAGGLALGGIAAAVAAVAAIGTAMVRTNKETEDLKARLTTLTGSAEKANQAFAALQQFADDTSFSLKETTDAFTTLINAGLNPSEAALHSFGNLAVATGNSLGTVVSLVQSATLGNFRGLKQLGIQAVEDGQNVILTYKGISETVKNSSQDIQNYLIKLSDSNFSNAIETQAKTLFGAFGDVGDAFERLLISLGGSGINSALAGALGYVSDFILKVSDLFSSGAINSAIDAFKARFLSIADDVARTFDVVKDLFDDIVRTINNGGIISAIGNIGRFLLTAFTDVVPNVRALIKSIVVEILAFADKAGAAFSLVKDLISSAFSSDVTVSGSIEKFQETLKGINETRENSLQLIFDERQASLSASDAMIAKAKTLYDAEEKRRKASGQPDRLAGLGVSANTSNVKPKDNKELQSLVESLLSEEEAIDASYQKRLKIIKDASNAEIALTGYTRDELNSRNEDLYNDQYAALIEKSRKEYEKIKEGLLNEEDAIRKSYADRILIVKNSQFVDEGAKSDVIAQLQKEEDTKLALLAQSNQRQREQLTQDLATEEELIRQSYKNREEDILNSTVFTESQKAALVAQFEQKAIEEMSALNVARSQKAAESLQGTFEALANEEKQRAGESSASYRALFAIEKGFAVTSAVLSIQQSLAKAGTLAFPLNIAEYGRVAALGASILTTIRGQNFSGGFDEGGKIPAGSIGLVGERGPELVSGPAYVTSRSDTAEKIDKAADSGAAAGSNIKVINVLDPSLVGQYLKTGEGEQAVLNIVGRNRSQLNF